MQEEQMHKRLLTVKEAAEDLGLSVHTIRSWVAQRTLASVRLGRAVRVPETEIQRLIDEGTTPQKRAASGARAA
jgi:excisionase family DNA binding protein